MRPRIASAAFAAFFALTGLHRDALAEAGPGTSSAEFLKIGVGARPAGIGGAFTGLSDDVHSLAYNPAGAAFLRYKEFGLVHDSYATGAIHEWAGYVHPTPWGTLGASANLLFITPFDSYDNVDRPSGKTSAQDSAYQLTYAATLTESLSLGLSGKYVASRLGNFSASAPAADAGLMWRPTGNVRFGAALLNVGKGLRYVSETTDLPRTLRVGASWEPFDPKDYANYFTLAVDEVKSLNEPAYVSGGVEFWYGGLMALRAGGRSDSSTGPGYTLGAGLYLFRDINRPYKLCFDYAFVDNGEFSQTHRVSIVLKFGEQLTESARSAVFRKEQMYDNGSTRAPRRRPVVEDTEPARKPDTIRPRAWPGPVFAPDDPSLIKP